MGHKIILGKKTSLVWLERYWLSLDKTNEKNHIKRIA